MSDVPPSSPIEDDPAASGAEWIEEQPTALEPPAVGDEFEQQLDSDNAKVDFVGELPTEVPPIAAREVASSEPLHADLQSSAPAADWENELSPQRLAVELRRIETDVRAIIDPRDSVRKRKLTGTHRWHELEEDIISWQYSGRFEQSQLQRVRELIVQRNHLFDHLRFLASTRPTWNS
ncbi:MAG: hypothetical protein HY287_17275 [Planctomycetes bacterium]|nr:hypothetical protein [Planctomycetota bacterium]MBI3836079.1 hypothetical protein [Planctomycetota bacterium]